MVKGPSQAFRYPGGKARIADAIRNWFPPRVTCPLLGGRLSCYCEPFVGSGAMLAQMLPWLPATTAVVIGDLDIGIACFWRSLLDREKSRRLCDMLSNFTPSVDEFYRLRESDGTHHGDDAETGFRKLVLHQMSFSGVGAKAGGPIGGRGQRGDYDVTCRFRPGRHASNIQSLRREFARLRNGRGGPR
jgi:DNA adenine methylase